MKRLFIFTLIIVLLLCGCHKKEPENVISQTAFAEKQQYLAEHQDTLKSAVMYHITLGGDAQTQLDTTLAAKRFLDIDTVTYSGMSVTDDYYTYSFVFEDGTEIHFSFENVFYCEGKDSYNLEGFRHFRED